MDELRAALAIAKKDIRNVSRYRFTLENVIAVRVEVGNVLDFSAQDCSCPYSASPWRHRKYTTDCLGILGRPIRREPYRNPRLRAPQRSKQIGQTISFPTLPCTALF